MHFSVTGADKESGSDVEVMVDGATQADAEAEACKRGILVSAIKVVPDNSDAIELVDDEPPAAASSASQAGASAAGRSSHGTITLNANSPSGSAQTGDGKAPSQAQSDSNMEYHILMNQSLYLLESAVNKQLREGWEPQGGLMVAFTNNQTQFYQAVSRRKKPGDPPAH